MREKKWSNSVLSQPKKTDTYIHSVFDGIYSTLSYYSNKNVRGLPIPMKFSIRPIDFCLFQRKVHTEWVKEQIRSNTKNRILHSKFFIPEIFSLEKLTHSSTDRIGPLKVYGKFHRIHSLNSCKKIFMPARKITNTPRVLIINLPNIFQE